MRRPSHDSSIRLKARTGRCSGAGTAQTSILLLRAAAGQGLGQHRGQGHDQTQGARPQAQPQGDDRFCQSDLEGHKAALRAEAPPPAATVPQPTPSGAPPWAER